VLPVDIFEACKLVQPSAEGEYQLSEAVGLLVYAGYTFDDLYGEEDRDEWADASETDQ